MSAMGEGDSDDEFFKSSESRHVHIKKIYQPTGDRIAYDYKFNSSSEDDDETQERKRKSPIKIAKQETRNSKQEVVQEQIPMTMPIPSTYPVVGYPMSMQMGIVPTSIPVMMTQLPINFPTQSFVPPPIWGPSGGPPRGPPPRPPFPMRPQFSVSDVHGIPLKRPYPQVTPNAYHQPKKLNTNLIVPTISKPPQLRKNAPSTKSTIAKDDKTGSSVFKNDGSFLEMFQKLQNVKKEQGTDEKGNESKDKQKTSTTSTPTTKPVVGMVGKRRGGRVLKTGMVEKVKQPLPESEPENGPKDAWSQYMAEVKKYRETNCEEERKTRALVK